MTDTMNPPTAMLRTIGAQPSSMPRGYFKAIEFPILAKLDETTGDRRRLLSSGADVRGLPLTIKFQSQTADWGHVGAEVSGGLFEVTIDPANNLMSGRGFLLDDEFGRRHARLVYTGAMRGNSVDLAEVRARLVEDLDSGEYWIEFHEFKLAATTGVATPAFADAHAVVDELSDDELMASWGDPMQPLVVDFGEFRVNIIGEPDVELTASTAAPFDAFYRPESDIPHKIIVDAELNAYGHLALWESCWSGEETRCLRPPRPRDNYASFNKPGVLTERGIVETGPIFAYGGHRPARSAPTIEQAYGGIENSWCDGRVIEGKHGPWFSGRVRPGTPDDVVYAARASRISGHWVNGFLKAIVSVNAEAFDVPGSGIDGELAAGFGFATNDVGITELVASFPDCAETPPQNQLVFNFSSDTDLNRIGDIVAAIAGEKGSANYWTAVLAATSLTTTTEVTMTETTTVVVDEPDELRQWADQRLADLLEDDRD